MPSFFDCNCVIGKKSVRRSGIAGEEEFYSIEDLLAEMNYTGIDEALVYHSLAKEYSPMIGNEKLMDEIKGYKRLHPCWVVMPNGTGEMLEPELLVAKMIKNNVKAARLFPSDHLYSLSEWCSGELLRELEKNSIVTIIEIDQISWDGLHDLCQRHPTLPVIITNLNYRVNRYLYPLLDKFDNIYVETSGYQVHKGIEDICTRFESEVLIFGSRMPQFTPGPAVNMINYSIIKEYQKDKIAGNNLRELLGIETGNKYIPELKDDIKGKAFTARKLDDEVIIDAHCHMGPYYNFHIPQNDAASIIQVMDNIGVKTACTSPHVGITPDHRIGNDMALKAMQDYPGRFFGYITLNPNYPDEIPEEIERCYKAGMRGFKIHPSLHSYPASGENLRPMWEFASEKKLPVLSHTWGGDGTCSPTILGKLAGQYPEVPVILGHSGGTPGGYDESIDAARKYDNVFLETCCSSVMYGTIERFVREIGPDRILFGSDMPFVNANAQIGKILYAKISDDDKKKILGLNASRILLT
ncbi:amidohydrolase family protein [Candidatus Poribacteria bacterium]|nr:amidohydrolase family protein [Candidatus Poribacteria bacterium]